MNKYTPVLKSTGERIEIKRPEFSEGFKHERSKARKGFVRDLDTGKRYEIKGKSCGTPRCMCDAWAVEVK